MFRQDPSQFSLFRGLNPQQMAEIERIMELCSIPQGAVIFEQGQSPDYLYILEQGEVLVRYKPYDGPPLTVAHILPGGVFGWSAALGRESYTSGAVAISCITAYRISGTRLQRLCKENPATGSIVLERLADVIAERLNSTHPQIMSILTKGLDLNKVRVPGRKHDRVERAA